MSHVLVVDSFSENLHFSAAKALYRRSLGYSALKEDDSAEKDLARALELVPQDAAINAELDKVRARKKEKRDKGKGKAREEPDPSQSSGSSTRWGLRRRRASEDLVEERRLQEEHTIYYRQNMLIIIRAISRSTYNNNSQLPDWVEYFLIGCILEDPSHRPASQSASFEIRKCI